MCVCVCIHPLHKYVSEAILFQCLFHKAGGTYLYKSYSYAPPQRVGILRRFGLKTGIGLPILVWSRVWLSRELRECMKVFIVSIPNEYPGKRERIGNGILRNRFVCCSNLSNDIFS